MATPDENSFVDLWIWWLGLWPICSPAAALLFLLYLLTIMVFMRLDGGLFV